MRKALYRMVRERGGCTIGSTMYRPMGIDRFRRGLVQFVTGEPKIVSVDRTEPFDPTTFIGQGWGLWRGPLDGDGLEGEIEQDERSLALTEIDLTRIGLRTCLRSGEHCLGGREFLRRLQAGNDILLDAGIFQYLWKNPHLFPLGLKEKIDDHRICVFFFGSPLRDPDGRCCILYLYWREGGLCWFFRHLGGECNPAAVLDGLSSSVSAAQ